MTRRLNSWQNSRSKIGAARRLSALALGLMAAAVLGTKIHLIQAAPPATPSATPVATATQRIEELKERLATKVAELRQTERRAVFGTVKSTTLTNLSVETKTKDVKIELTDDINIAQYLKGKRTTLSLDDVARGDTVSIFGDYDPTLDLLKAKFIFIEGSLPILVNGVVSAVNKGDYSLTLTTPQGSTYTIDIETFTKIIRWGEEKKFTKSGFSKIIPGEVIHVNGSPVPKKENRLSAQRILDLGFISGTPPTATAEATPTEEPTPKATPTASPKTTPKPTATPTP